VLNVRTRDVMYEGEIRYREIRVYVAFKLFTRGSVFSRTEWIHRL